MGGPPSSGIARVTSRPGAWTSRAVVRSTPVCAVRPRRGAGHHPDDPGRGFPDDPGALTPSAPVSMTRRHAARPPALAPPVLLTHPAGVPWRRWRDLVVAAAVAALALAEAAQVYVGLALQRAEVTWAEALRLTAPSWGVLLVLTLPLLRVLDRADSGVPGPARLGLYALGALAFSALHLAGSALLWEMAGVAGEGFRETFYRLSTLYFVPGVLTFGTVVTVHALVRGYGEERRREVAAADLRAEDALARLQVLRGHLRPDFFFNTLNAATALTVRGDVQGSLEILSSLSTLLRVSMAGEGNGPARLGDEVALAAAYLAIQEVRFRDRLSARCHLDPGAAVMGVPPLILIRAVEQVVDAGLALGRPFALEVVARVEGGEVRVDLVHTVAGIGPEVLGDLSRRMVLLDPGGRLSQSPAGISLVLPARPAQGVGPQRSFEVAP